LIQSLFYFQQPVSGNNKLPIEVDYERLISAKTPSDDVKDVSYFHHDSIPPASSATTAHFLIKILYRLRTVAKY